MTELPLQEAQTIGALCLQAPSGICPHAILNCRTFLESDRVSSSSSAYIMKAEDSLLIDAVSVLHAGLVPNEHLRHPWRSA